MIRTWPQGVSPLTQVEGIVEDIKHSILFKVSITFFCLLLIFIHKTLIVQNEKKKNTSYPRIFEGFGYTQLLFSLLAYECTSFLSLSSIHDTLSSA